MGNGTSIGRVRGLGSAHHGAHHWLLQRFTALGNLVLGLFLFFSLIGIKDLSFSVTKDWISQPVVAVAIGLFILSTFWHAKLGLQVVIEDYVHDSPNKVSSFALLNLVTFAATGFALFCVIRLALGA